MMVTVSLKRRVEALEKVVAGSEEVGLEALVRYSMHPHLYDAETARRIEESRLYRLAQESAARGSEPQGRAMNAQEPKRRPAGTVGPANGISLDEQLMQTYRDHSPTPMKKPSVVEHVAEPQPEARKPEPPALIKAEPGLSLDALIMRDGASLSPARAEPSRQAFDDWVGQNMLWLGPER
jgi:hypothetical protein